MSDLSVIVVPDGAGVQPEERDDEAWALDIIQALNRHYPGHPWMVSFSGGALVIRHMDIAAAVAMKTGRHQFATLLPPHRQGTRKETIHNAVRFAGELLEAFQMPRGAWREECPPVCPDWRRGKSRGFN